MTPKRTSRTVNNLSATDVLEKIATGIYNQEKEKVYPYENELKGILSNAIFVDQLRKELNIESPGPSDSCSLDHKFHTNINTGYTEGRKPCYERNEKRFSNEGEAKCGSDKIRDYGIKSAGGACAPFRRQNLCDRNLEYLINKNTNTTHDLLGNVLVTAKYEGDSIVNNHPDKNSSGNKSSICTALARSFADIGDIVRGRDMFKPNDADKVEKGLQVVFGKIYNSLPSPAQKHYAHDDGSGNYYKLREDWWAINRKEVWKAITCRAPNEANFFRNISGNMKAFTSQGYCGHSETNVPTNLDYVPQFLRWFDEWAEEFCRIRKIKLENVKKECRDEPNNKYCSGDGHDCKRTYLKDNTIFIDLNCPRCENACSNYTKWIEIQRKQFDKQKRKYMNEIKIKTNISNNENDKEFYENLDKKGYSTINTFLESLNHGKQCQDNIDKKNKTNFKNNLETFGPSGYCEACPIYGVKCSNEKCTPVTENEWNSNNRLPTDTSTKNLNATNIDMLVNDGIGNAIDNELEKNCTKYGILKGIKKQKWQCQYLNNIDQCKINNVMNSGYFDNKIAFNVLFQRWLRYFVRDHNRLKEKIDVCIKKENINENICIKRCKTNCECVGKWLEKKEAEWDKINQHYNQKKSHYVHTIPYWITGFYEKITFPNDFFKALEDVDTINVLDTLKECQDTHCKIEKIRSIDVDFIKEIISWLQNKIEVCKSHHDEDKHEYCCDILPKSVDDDEEDDEEVDEEKEESSQTTKRNISQKGGTKSASCVKGACAIVKGVLQQKSNGSIDNCNAKNRKKNEWQCDKNTFVDGNEGVCMPPRRKSICIHNLTLEEQTKNKYQLREAFIKCAAKETNLLWDKYKNDKNEAEELLKKGKIPEDFMRIMFYTFGDFRDFCLENDMGKDVDKVKKNINKVFNNSSKRGFKKIDPENWWNENGPQIWNGMLCALIHADTKDSIKNKDNYKYEKVTILAKRDGSNGMTLSEFAKKPKFLRWFVEWYDDYCKERQKYLTEVASTCKSIDGGQLKCDRGCNNKCDEYKKYMRKKKEEWNLQDKYYKDKRENKGIDKGPIGIIVKDYVLANAKEYLKKKFTASCVTSSGKAQNSATEEVKKNIELLSEEQYYDADQYCGCTKFIHDDKYSKISGRSNCCGLNSDAKKNKIKWRNSDEKDYAFLKKRNLSGDVFFPSRRLRICFHALDGNYTDPEVKDENGLRKRLMEVAATEGDNLSQYYKEKKEKETEATEEAHKYSYEVQPCSAMKYSFYDLRDIILGYDNLEDNSTTTEKNLKKIFKSESNEGSQGRQTFWNNNKDCVWEAMKCGYKHGRDDGNSANSASSDQDLKKCDSVPSDDDYPMGKDRDEGTAYQFLRWFAEWGEDFCKHKEKELEKLVGACNDYKCGDNEDKKKKCTDACTQYKQFISGWKPQYEKQIKKYGKHKDKIYSRHPMVKEAKDAQEYLDKQLQKSCNSGGKCDCMNKKSTSNGNNMPASLDETPSTYKDRCECQPPPPPPPPAPARPPAARESGNDYRGRSEPGEDGPLPLPLPPPTPPKPGGDGGAGRILSTPRNGTIEEDEEDDDEGEEKAEAASEETESKEVVEQKEDTTEKVCKIVANILTGKGNLDDACNQKYGYPQRHWGWKCVTPTTSSSTSERGGASRNKRNLDSTKSSDKNGSICIPPRRRKLYIKKIQEWASGNTQAGGNTGSGDSTGASSNPQGNGVSTSPQVALLHAFVESAAVETFFLWDRYKKEKEIEKKQQQETGLVASETSEDTEHPQNKLQSGTIPLDFLRQMFYTLGDYRDICVGKTPDGIDTVSASDKDTMDKIQAKIQQILPKKDTPPSVKTPQQTWWNKHAESIWNGMIYALTYKTDTPSGEKPKQIPEVKTKLFDEKGTPQSNKYQYKTVKLEEEETSGAKPKSTESSSPSGENTPLTDFISRPPYFRYLEEWGQNFCKERKKRLEDIKSNCLKDGDKQYSGDGEACSNIDVNKDKIFADLEGPKCAKPCSSYRKWIKGKKTQYEKQEKAYEQQKEQCKKETNNHYNGFRVKLGTCTTAGDFLQTLKNGPCKSENGKDHEEDEINFSQPDVTFRPATNCTPCPKFKVNCKNGNCGADTNGKCNGKTPIDAQNFEQMGQTAKEFVMLVSDKSTNGFEVNDLNECAGADIFQGIKENIWSCRNVCGLDVCKPEKVNDQKVNGKENDGTYIIQIRALLRRWVENFLEDYKKIKHKISHCTNSTEEKKSTCDCGKKCKCVGQWIKLKKEEWKKIKEHYVGENKSEDDFSDNLNSFLETLITQIPVADVQGNVIKLSNFDTPCGCSADANSQKKDGNENDAIDCMINRLQQKAKNCETQPSGSKQCTTPPTTLEDDETFDDDIETDNPVAHPQICEGVIQTQTETVLEEKCDAPPAEEKKDEKKKPEDPAEEDGGAIGPSGPAGPQEPSPTSDDTEENHVTPEEDPPPPAPDTRP
ncbi:hypothetical protein PFFVO_03832, partial [Plasmodium falciparum Vietnam Oak-Knoll (FVO)]